MAPTVFTLTGSDADPDAAIAAASRALQRGGLVLLPTETVYGLAAGLAHAHRLTGLKGRPGHQPLTLHLGDTAAATDHGVFGPRTRRLAEQFWPGPLTLVVPARPGVPGAEKAGERTIGLRVPAEATTAAVLRAVGGAWMTSANRAGDPPMTRPAAITAAFGEELEVAVDAGEATAAEASTVLWCVDPDYRVLRQGSIPADELLRVAARRVVFVCTGNTCRSPMAAALAHRELSRALDLAPQRIGTGPDPVLARGLEVVSAGVAAVPEFPASEGSLKAAAEIDLDLSAHRSTQLDADGVARAWRIYCLSPSHRDRILEAVPDAGPRVELLHPDGREIADPFGGEIEHYRAARDDIAAAVRARLPDLLALLEDPPAG